jgi:plasmid stabilization system protein ParE
MIARTVVIRPIALANLRDYARYISQHTSPASATRWLAAIRTTIGRLATEADRYPQADEADVLGIDLRQQLHGRRPHVYRVLFTVDGDTIHVLRVRHAAQDHLTEDEV